MKEENLRDLMSIKVFVDTDDLDLSDLAEDVTNSYFKL